MANFCSISAATVERVHRPKSSPYWRGSLPLTQRNTCRSWCGPGCGDARRLAPRSAQARAGFRRRLEPSVGRCTRAWLTGGRVRINIKSSFGALPALALGEGNFRGLRSVSFLRQHRRGRIHIDMTNRRLIIENAATPGAIVQSGTS